MRDRCSNPKNKSYPYYGGRGIKVCERWRDFDNFIADMGRCPEGLTLERVDVNGDYEASNCRWASMKEQMRNKRNSRLYECDGKMLTFNELKSELKICQQRLRKFLDDGLTVDEIRIVRYEYKTTTSGYKGIVARSDRKKWVVIIPIDGKQRRMGHFKSLEEAIAHRDKLVAELGMEDWLKVYQIRR